MASTSSPTASTEPVPSPRKKRGLFGFLFKSALGCTAFAVGALIVLVLLLPSMVGGVVARTAQSKFGDQFKGSLEVGAVKLAWFGEQRVSGVIVRDPDKKEVARASLVLPSLMTLLKSNMTRIGRVTVDLDADLVQDDAGVTNLERALEPRVKSAPTPPKPGDRAAKDDMLDKLARLELDLEVTSSHLTWSDAETRRLGIPFEVRDLKATVKAKGGTPIDVHAAGRVVSEQPGTLELDAHIAGPIEPKSAWPLGKVDAKARIEGFSTAMIDGIAGLHGNLKEVLGNRFTLKVDAVGASADTGDVDLVLEGERGKMAVHGRLEGGAFHSRAPSESEPALLVTIPPPRGFLQTYVTPSLPPGTKLVFDNSNEPWTVRAQSFVVPLPASAAMDTHAMTTTLAKVQLELSAAVPGRISVENEATRTAKVAASVSATRVDVHLVPGAPATIHLEAALDSGSPGTLAVDVSAQDPWAKLAQGTIPPVDAHVIAKDVSTAAIGSLAGEPERIPGAIGRLLDVRLDAQQVNLEGGSVHLNITGRDETARLVVEAGARIEGGLVHIDGEDALRVRWSPAQAWLQGEIAALLAPGAQIVPDQGSDLLTLEVTHVVLPLPGGAPQPAGTDWMSTLRATTTADVKAHLSGATWSDETLRAAHKSVALRALDVAVHLAPGGAVGASVHGDVLEGASKGRLAAEVSTANAWAFAGKPGAPLPPVDAHVAVEDVPTALVDTFVQKNGIVGRALGDKLSVSLDARGASTTSGTVHAELTAPRASATLAGRLENGSFRAEGADGVHVTAKIPDAALRDEIAGMLPPGTTLTWSQGVMDVTLQVSDISVPVPPAGSTAPFDLAGTLEATSAHVHASVAAVGIRNEQTQAAKLDVGARDIQLDAVLAPKAPLDVKLTADLSPGRDAKLALDARIVEPFGILRGAPLKPVDATVRLTGLDTKALDALAGREGLLAGLLGPSLDASLEARGASTAGGAMIVSAKSESMTLAGSARFENGTLRCTGKEGLEVTLVPRPGSLDAYVKSALPAGMRLELAPDAGPLTVKVHDVSIALASAEPAKASAKPAARPIDAAAETVETDTSGLERLSKMALTFEAIVPALVYSDASTDAAKRPVTVRNLRMEAHLSPTELPFLRASGTVEDEPPGEISADVRALDPLAKLAEPKGKDTWRMKVDLRATKVPTAILDMVAGQGGLLVEALGARVEATLQAPDISMTRGAFVADMHSDLHKVHAEGHLADSSVVIDKTDGLLAQVGLGPIMSQRVVGKLVPTLIDVEKPEGAAPAIFAIDALRFPLDGDLRKLDGNVRIDLGEVVYGLGNSKQGLIGKIAAALGESLPTGQWKVPAIVVPIQKGVAGYQRLPIQIGGHEYVFSGTYDMVTDVAQLTAQVPVKLLGKKISAELERVREYIDPDITVPITIKGSIRNPSIGLDNGALEKVLKKAAEKALGKGLGGLLDGLNKKKKD